MTLAPKVPTFDRGDSPFINLVKPVKRVIICLLRLSERESEFYYMYCLQQFMAFGKRHCPLMPLKK